MSNQTTIKTTCPRDCYDSCGISVTKNGDEVVTVTGDRGHPLNRGSLCGKCSLAYNGAWRDPDLRLARPLKRVGPKGSGRFEPVSWDEALSDIAKQLNDIRIDDPAKILTAHYTGTCSAIANGFPMRFFNAVGATEVEPDTICNNAGHVALTYVYGTPGKGIDPRTARDSSCLLVWGCNPHASGPHVHKHWLPELPGTLIVVDPIRTPTAELADLHLQPFPGTDAALAFAMLHVIRSEGLLDRDFIAANTVGFDELEPLIDGCTAGWGEQTTGVPAAEIEQAARAFAAGPSILWLGQALQRQRAGGNVFRAVAMLPALTGNIGKPGAGFYFLNGKGPTRGMDMGYVPMDGLRQGPAASISHMDLPATLEDPDKAKALVLWNINIAASNPDQQRLHAALRRDDLFTVVIDLFQTDSADLADYVLPAASFLEFDDIVGSYMHLSLGAQAKAMEPVGEALPNQEIFRRLARAMGMTQLELYEDDRSIIDYLLNSTGLGITFDDLKRHGTLPVSREPLILFDDLKFPTPSGKIEIACPRASTDGQPRTAQPTADARPEGGLLRLLSPASEWHMNSSYDNDARIAARTGQAVITLHPADAAARGLGAGDRARVQNETGLLEMTVAVADLAPPGTAISHKGRWPKRDPGHANVNALNPGLRTDMGDSTALHSVEVSVDPV